jgi:uncharacterized SAM-dependent methyltransferase
MITLVSAEVLEGRLLESLERRQLPDYFLYLGEKGVRRWLELDQSDEFPIAARLTALLGSSMRLIVRQLPATFDLVSIGCGGGSKERLLLQSLGPRQSARYFPVDVSSGMVDAALARVEDLDVEATGVVALFEDLPAIAEHWRRPVLLCMLGNNLCNYEPDSVMRAVRAELKPEDYFLFDCHLFSASAKSIAEWEAGFARAYQSDPNVRFNIGPLVDRGMDPKDCEFRLKLLPAETPFGRAFVTRKSITILNDVRINVGGVSVELSSGDTLSMGFTYKYRPSQIQGYLQQSGFVTVEEFLSRDGENLLVLARLAPHDG